MKHKTKIVATIGPGSNSPDIIREMIKAGISVARLNFSHGSYEDHASMVSLLTEVSSELDTPVTLLQHLHRSRVRKLREFVKFSRRSHQRSKFSLIW